MGNILEKCRKINIVPSIKEFRREEINDEKFKIFLELDENGEINILKQPIILEVIHVETIDSTMPASREYIDKGNKDPFIYNTVIQTAGKGKGTRKWVGSIEGNIYTSSCILFLKKSLKN